MKNLKAFQMQKKDCMIGLVPWSYPGLFARLNGRLDGRCGRIFLQERNDIYYSNYVQKRISNLRETYLVYDHMLFNTAKRLWMEIRKLIFLFGNETEALSSGGTDAPALRRAQIRQTSYAREISRKFDEVETLEAHLRGKLAKRLELYKKQVGAYYFGACSVIYDLDVETAVSANFETVSFECSAKPYLERIKHAAQKADELLNPKSV